eukprot:2596992-Amphidinium_carterae.2
MHLECNPHGNSKLQEGPHTAKEERQLSVIDATQLLSVPFAVVVANVEPWPYNFPLIQSAQVRDGHLKPPQCLLFSTR